MKRLAVILPYDERHIKNFTDHFKETIKESSEMYYKLVFIKQKSNRPLNKGKLFNIGYQLMKDKFDYFCFHDIDLIPISDECNYTYEERPLSLVSMRKQMEFGDQSEVEEFNDFTLPYEEYFGGVTLFTKEHFKLINGYSNEYWGVGYEDWDILLRCVVKGLPVRTEMENEVTKTYGRFNGSNSYMKVLADNAKIRNVTNKDFTISTWFFAKDIPPYGESVDNNRCEYSIFSRPGFHTGLSYTHGGFLKCIIWVRPTGKNEREPVLIQVPLRPETWYHLGMVVDDRKQTLSLFINGVKIKTESYDGELIPYLNKPYYIGVGDPDLSVWRNFFKGYISEVGLWSEALSRHEIETIFNQGITNIKGEYVTSTLPVGLWDFRSGYDDVTFDSSGNGNHAKFYNVGFANKSLKSNKERYLPYRRKGAYGYLSADFEYQILEDFTRSDNPEIVTNRNIFNKKVGNQMSSIKTDGLSSTRFRIVDRQDYEVKHEIIEVVI